jgi:hypothetical protein
MNKLNPPEGWIDVTDQAVHSFQVFAPDGSYGTADSDADISEYTVTSIFQDMGQFLHTRLTYCDQLLNWALQLPENTDITTLKNVKSQIGLSEGD